MIPEKFKERMKLLLGGEYEEFLEALEQDRYQALRVNPMKMDREEFLRKAPFSLTPVPWEENGFYYKKEETQSQPGKHPWHEAGVYYIQEPSAMSAVPFLEARPGERILRGNGFWTCAPPPAGRVPRSRRPCGERDSSSAMRYIRPGRPSFLRISNGWACGTHWF